MKRLFFPSLALLSILMGNAFAGALKSPSVRISIFSHERNYVINKERTLDLTSAKKEHKEALKNTINKNETLKSYTDNLAAIAESDHIKEMTQELKKKMNQKDVTLHLHSSTGIFNLHSGHVFSREYSLTISTPTLRKQPCSDQVARITLRKDGENKMSIEDAVHMLFEEIHNDYDICVEKENEKKQLEKERKQKANEEQKRKKEEEKKRKKEEKRKKKEAERRKQEKIDKMNNLMDKFSSDIQEADVTSV